MASGRAVAFMGRPLRAHEGDLAVSGHTREQTLAFDEPAAVMRQMDEWVVTNCSQYRTFISDNNGFDWQFINWYSHHCLGSNPFGLSSQNLGSLCKGFARDTQKNFKHLRRTRHSHHPVEDAMGNAEALLIMAESGLKIRWI